MAHDWPGAEHIALLRKSQEEKAIHDTTHSASRRRGTSISHNHNAPSGFEFEDSAHVVGLKVFGLTLGRGLGPGDVGPRDWRPD
jgi:hypothetical protein